MFGEVIRRTAHNSPVRKKLHGNIVRVGYPANPDAQIVSLPHQVHEAIGEIERQLEVRKFLMKTKCVRSYVHPSKGSRCRYKQVSSDVPRTVADARFHIIEFAHQVFRPLQKLLSKLSQMEASSRTMHEFYAQPFLERIQTATEHCSRDTFANRSSGKAAFLGYLNEALKLCKPRHSIPFISTETNLWGFKPNVQ
ncbi:hypothetical protein PspTeo4_18944 [Pseudomonas sp. Teo4]|nr:hypothetical protein [Pseudomonas sp. Teo4]